MSFDWNSKKVHSKKHSKGPFEEAFEEHSKEAISPFEREQAISPFEREHSKETIIPFEREHSKASCMSFKIQKGTESHVFSQRYKLSFMAFKHMINVTNPPSWLSKHIIKVI